MKKRSRLTKRKSTLPQTFDPKSEERLPVNNHIVQKRQSTSETSLLLYKQLNRVFDVLKYEFDTRAEGPNLLSYKLQEYSSAQRAAMASPQERIAEIQARMEELEREKEEKVRTKQEKEEAAQAAEERTAEMDQEIADLGAAIDQLTAESDSLKEELKTLEAPAEPEPEPPKADTESIIRIKTAIQAELNKMEEDVKKGTATDETNDNIAALNELLATKSEQRLRDWERERQRNIAVMPALVDQPGGGEGSASKVTAGSASKVTAGSASKVQAEQPPSQADVKPPSGEMNAPTKPMDSSPPVPPPTPDGGGRKAAPTSSDFPLYDSAVLVELREADERANKASKAIEAVREQLAAYAKKDEMTPEDIKMMEEKQKELMDKMTEFEEITKRVQHLVGLVDVASSQLGPPEKPMVPVVEGIRTVGPGQTTRPEDTLPKVIVCGTGDVDQVPKIIVCEPRKARDGKAPLYQQLEGKPKSKGEDSREPGRKCPPSCGGAANQPGGYPGFGGQMGMAGMYGMGGPQMGMGGPQMGMGGPQMGMGGPQMGMGGPQMGMGGPQMGMGGPQMGMTGPPMGGTARCGMGGPGFMPGMMPPGPPGMMMSSFGPPPCMMGAGGMPPGPCPCRTKKKKGKISDKETEVHSADLERRLEASLNMSEMLADQNTKLEGSRYELQEAVLDKDKQHDALMIELQNLKLQLQTCKNENKELKNNTQKAEAGQGDPKQCMDGLQQGGKKPGSGGLCKKDLRTMPICKAQAFKEMGLPLPRNEIRPQCPGAKFAVSMGWNENQGCRNELQKSMNCPDMKGTNAACPPQGCVCTSKGPQACPVHKGCPQGAKRPMMGSGDIAHNPLCPCGCMAPAGQCKRADMEAVVQTMEQEVKSLQNELELVQAERRGLALQKKLLNCMAESSGAPVPASAQRSLGGGSTGGGKDCGPPPNKPLVLIKKAIPDNLSTVELQLNSLREQYRKLQEDFNAKVEEVSMVRVEYEAAKRDALSLQDKCREAEARVDDLLERLRAIEMEKNKMAGSKDQMMELEQQLTMAKQRYREGQEELEEIKTTMQDQMLQLDEYRNKYLSAQQTVEEQRRQIDIMELENNRISEQVNLEIQRVKNQFQEKLTELTPLPDMLKATQMKLQECDQLRQLAERNVEQLLNQTDELKDQNAKLESELEELRKHTATQAGEKESLTRGLTTGEKKIEEIKSENNKLRATVKRLEEVALNNDRRLDEKNHEVLQLQTQLETLREESARQVSRTKDRCEAVRRTLQGQISQLECQLAQSRAAARTAQKDRDEIRQRMQAQITSLNDNFEQAQLRIRSLQSHVNYLKSSYTNIFAPEQNTPMGPKPIDGLSTC